MITLKRIHSDNQFTYGVLCDAERPLCVTLELPYRNNMPFISSIPIGIYDLTRHNSPNHGDCFKVHNVHGRKHILIHKGNFIKDTHGCILTGQSFGHNAILNSSKAMDLLFKSIPDKTKLKIIEV